MRQVALETLASEFQSTKESEQWYEEARASSADKLLKYLVESPESEANFYTLRSDPNDAETSILEQWQTKPEHLTSSLVVKFVGFQFSAQQRTMDSDSSPLHLRPVHVLLPGPKASLQRAQRQSLQRFQSSGRLHDSGVTRQGCPAVSVRSGISTDLSSVTF